MAKALLKFLAFLSALTVFVGVGSFLFYPFHVASETYISENALKPNFVLDYGHADLIVGKAFTEKYSSFQRSLPKGQTCESWNKDSAKWLQKELKALGFSVYTQTYLQKNGSVGETVFLTVRAPRADGTESFVVGTKFEPLSSDDIKLSALGLTVSLIQALRGKAWLARDYHFVFTASCVGPPAFTEWLRFYHGDIEQAENQQKLFRRSPLLAALHLEIDETSAETLSFDVVSTLLHGENGQLPNLDYLNVVKRLGVAEKIFMDLGPITTISKTLLDYLEPDQQILFDFMIKQAFGNNEGNHVSGRTFNIESLTLRASGQGPHSFDAFGKLIEGTLRSMNSVSEHLHQSFYYYLLSSDASFISIGQYVVSLGLLLTIFILPVVVALIGQTVDVVYAFCICVVSLVAGGAILLFPRLTQLPQLQALLPTCADGITYCWLGYSLVIVCCTWFAWSKIDAMVIPVPRPQPTNGQEEDNADDEAEHLVAKRKRIQMLSAFVWFPSMVFLSTQSLINIGFSVIALMVIYPFYLYILYPILIDSDHVVRWRRTSVVLLILLNPIFIILFVKVQPMLLAHLDKVDFTPIKLALTEVSSTLVEFWAPLENITRFFGAVADLARGTGSPSIDVAGLWVGYLKNDSNYNPVVFIFLIFIYLPFNLVTLKVFLDS